MKAQLGMLVLLASASLSTSAVASMDLIKKARCNACHAVDKKLVGPSFRDVAGKYKGQADAPAALFAKVRHGGAGSWGDIPMTPNDESKISDENLKSAITWILNGAPD